MITRQVQLSSKRANSDMLQQIRANFARSILGLPVNVRDNAISRFHCLLGAQGQGENAR